jgi:hypothetical protein
MSTTIRAALTPPPWAQALIVAELEHDDCDSMTDYYSTHTSRIVALAWSRHTRDLFAELRKAAALLPETAHMGPGMGRWRPMVVLADDAPRCNGVAYWKGGPTHWHHELQTGGEWPTFTTEAEARAYMASKGDPEPIHLDGSDAPTRFAWELQGGERQIEHREKYSMGHGYYLKAGQRYGSGWVVRKQGLPLRAESMEQVAQLAGGRPAAEAGGAEPVADVTIGPGRNGNVEIRFPAKPSAEVREALKARGFRWSGASCCWYGPADGVPGCVVTSAQAEA